MDYALEVKDLVKRYGRRTVLDRLSLAVPEFSSVGLVGPNGAGKTTFMMTVVGFVQPTSGDINLLGNGPFSAEVHSGRISILPQDSELPLEGKPQELLEQYGILQGLSARDARLSAAELLKAVNLSDRADSQIRTLSHGMRKRVMVAQCFVGFPELVLLDEPLSGLDPLEVSRMRAFIQSRRGRQTIVISSHNLHDIEILCTHVVMIDRGRVTRFEEMERLTEVGDRLVYKLTAVPGDLEVLKDAVPGLTLKWYPNDNSLVCVFSDSGMAPEKINAALLPILLEQTGVLSISQGSSLEAAYLKEPV